MREQIVAVAKDPGVSLEELLGNVWGKRRRKKGKKVQSKYQNPKIATVIGVHPLSLVAYAYVPASSPQREQFWAAIAAEVDSFDSDAASTNEGVAC